MVTAMASWPPPSRIWDTTQYTFEEEARREHSFVDRLDVGIGAGVLIRDLLTYGLANAIAALFSGVSVVYVFRTLRSLV